MSANDGLRQASVRALTGTALDYNGDWMALFDQSAIPHGGFEGRLLAWLNERLGGAHTEINGAMAAFALQQGSPSWSAMGGFSAGPLEGAGPLTESGGALETEGGGRVLNEVQPVLTETGGAALTESGGLTLME